MVLDNAPVFGKPLNANPQSHIRGRTSSPSGTVKICLDEPVSPLPLGDPLWFSSVARADSYILKQIELDLTISIRRWLLSCQKEKKKEHAIPKVKSLAVASVKRQEGSIDQ